MTYNISGRKQNLTLQRCNCTPYLKRDIDIPANCTIISEKTFQNRSMIQSVSFPYGLKQLLLPESLCQIGKEAFSDCTTLSSIYIPQYISTISKGMLRNAHKLSETLFSSESRLLKIQADAFSECSALREISFPDSLQEIGNGSFYKCKNLSEVHFSENLKVISNQAFYSCGLTSLELPDSLEILDESAFFKCNNLITVTLPPNVRYIGKWVFHGCNRLQYLEIRHDPE